MNAKDYNKFLTELQDYLGIKVVAVRRNTSLEDCNESLIKIATELIGMRENEKILDLEKQLAFLKGRNKEQMKCFKELLDSKNKKISLKEKIKSIINNLY